MQLQLTELPMKTKEKRDTKREYLMTVHVALKDTFVSVSFPADLTCVGPYTSVHIDVLLVRNSVHKTLEIN